MIQWHERFFGNIFCRLFLPFYSRVFTVMLACIGVSSIYTFWLSRSEAGNGWILRAYLRYATYGACFTFGAVALSLAVGIVVMMRRPPIARIDEIALAFDRWYAPLPQMEDVAISYGRVRGPILWIGVDGKRHGIGLPRDRTVVADVFRLLRSSVPSMAVNATLTDTDNHGPFPPRVSNILQGSGQDTCPRGSGAVEWSESFLGSLISRLVFPVALNFLISLFALAGAGALTAYLFTRAFPALRGAVQREYFETAYILSLYFIAFVPGGILVGAIRYGREPPRVHLDGNRIDLCDRRISLFRIAAAEVRRRRLRGPLLRLLVDGRWIGVGLPRDGESITKIAELLRSRGKTVRDAART